MNTLQGFLEKDFLNIHSPGYVIEMFYNDSDKEFVLGKKCILPNEELTTPNTLYDIASLTKIFTSTLIYKAYEESLLDLNQSVFSLNNKFSNLKEVTILDLLCHNQEIYTKGYLGDAKNIQEFMEILYSSYVLKKVPTYVDVNYIILSNVLEKIYNKSFNELVYQKIIKPLDLKNTTFNPNPKNCASCNYEYVNNTLVVDLPLGIVHDKKARKAQEFGIYTGHAGLFASGKDILKFLKSFLDYPILKKDTINLMLKHYDNNKYNFMGCRYYSDNLKNNNDPVCLSKNSITFSGFTGPMFIFDFDKRIIVLVMCNVLHNTKIDRSERKKKTSEIINYILNKVIKNN